MILEDFRDFNVLVLVILEKFVLHSENIKNNCEKI